MLEFAGADYLIGSLPFPANQLCTDDFTGRLANNTNLAAKGIVALEAFSHLCAATAGKNCQHYSDAATGFVSTWMKEALEQKPKPHYKIACELSFPFAKMPLHCLEHLSLHNSPSSLAASS